jgi:hypothetical protein
VRVLRGVGEGCVITEVKRDERESLRNGDKSLNSKLVAAGEGKMKCCGSATGSLHPW